MSEIGYELPSGFTRQETKKVEQNPVIQSYGKDHRETALRLSIEFYKSADNITPDRVVETAETFYQFLVKNRLSSAKRVAEQLKLGEVSRG